MDMGSAVDLVAALDIPKQWRSEIVEGDPLGELGTANGIIQVTK